MKAKHRFIIAVIVLGLLMTGPFVVTSALVWLDMREAERNMLTDLLLSRLPQQQAQIVALNPRVCCAWRKPCA